MAKKIVKPTDGPSADLFELEAQGYAEQAEEVATEQKAARVVAYREKEQRVEEAVKIESLVERGKEIADVIQFADIKKVRMGDMFIAVPEPTDTNKRIVLDYLFKGTDQRPHFDEFRGRIVDHKGVIMDDFYDGTDYLDAYNAVGLRKLELDKVIKAVRQYALRNRQNDLKVRLEKLIPEWDGVDRMQTALIDMFDSQTTPLNKEFGFYFWLSLYCRCMFPGEEAPIVLTLIGSQGCGKSYFGKLLTRIVTGDPESDSVQLNLDGNKVDFLREITGQSVIASVGEMSGFSKSDLNRMKDTITRTHDKFSYKFEGVIHQPRQWITIMDANKYEGLLRDDTGNRRFYPMFCGQLPDVAGKQQWKQDFKADFSLVRENLWQIMAEARSWIESNGIDEYRDMVRRVSKRVFDFSITEMSQDRGTINDDVFDIYLVEMLKQFPGKFVWIRKVGGNRCIGIKTSEFKMFFQDTLKHVKPFWKHLRPKMLALGAKEHLFTGGYAGYLFSQFTDIKSFDEEVGNMKDFEGDGHVDSATGGARKAKVTGF